MSESLLKSLKARGESFFTDVSNSLLANPAFIEMLKRGMAAKEIVDEQVALAMKRMNVANRKELSRLEQRIAALEAEIAALKGAAAGGRRRGRSGS
jgi:uncharacterized small protein (DUF1192 family)